jgi:uncharacterized protein
VTDRLRVVLDTNIFVSAFLSRNPSSPTREIIQRWLADEFTLLVSDALLEEIAEKLQMSGIQEERIVGFLTLLSRLALSVEVPPESVKTVVSADPDDDHVLACAVLGTAHYLVTYDAHFDSLGGGYSGIKIVKALPFLWALRGDTPKEP